MHIDMLARRTTRSFHPLSACGEGMPAGKGEVVIAATVGFTLSLAGKVKEYL